ncbi:MAG: arsenate reductase [Deltaproteobacteria bacterium CG_4_10_14_0_2_um_filter_43_8]|nr:MAG: arsenate reductase [Deltaproteobacteria bacterium CG11_big_fil_rev_8_21_14_0_20_42_23]PJA20112.1 MAG: arsenate reductase [Deltaproteobacteria bacterium CG_4_10_14_0_2_um_filter_43_8]PJC64989.1 MAG: arsenate reductase [Deltaproteobacteria bacterium CG_4_9_14_0_2_um_filter_42_21]
MSKINILFLCTGNSCRSQMAEGWAKHLKSDKINAYSAGIETHGLNQNAVKVMAEAGVDISKHRSQHVDELKNISFDYVVTICGHANESCPIFPGNTKVVHFGFDDPPKLAKELAEKGASEEEQLNCYRKVRDEIKHFVETLPETLSGEKKKGFFSKMFDKLDKKLEAKSKKSSCCTPSNKGGSSCC